MKKGESWFSGDEGAGAPHTIPVPLGPSPAAEAWGQRTDKVSRGGGGSLETGKGQRPNCGPSYPPFLLWDWPLFVPQTEEDERGLVLSYP